MKSKQPITIASQITLARILLVPVFAVFAIRYSQSVQAGAPDEQLRWFAVAAFATASLTDGIDGFVARHFNQCSQFGAFIDPIADKLLLLTGIITLSLAPWGNNHWHIPLWLAALVVTRDVIILGGISILYYLKHHVPIKPSKIGKLCTVSQMTLIIWIMVKLTSLPIIYPSIIAAIFTLWSGILYVRQGFQIRTDTFN